MTKPSTSVVNLRLDTGTIEAIRAVAVEEGRTWAGQVRYILAGWMRSMDDEEGWERCGSYTIRDRPSQAGRIPNSALYAKPRDRVGRTTGPDHPLPAVAPKVAPNAIPPSQPC